MARSKVFWELKPALRAFRVALEIPRRDHADTLDDIHTGTASGGITTCIDRLCENGPINTVVSRGGFESFECFTWRVRHSMRSRTSGDCLNCASLRELLWRSDAVWVTDPASVYRGLQNQWTIVPDTQTRSLEAYPSVFSDYVKLCQYRVWKCWRCVLCVQYALELDAKWCRMIFATRVGLGLHITLGGGFHTSQISQETLGNHENPWFPIDFRQNINVFSMKIHGKSFKDDFHSTYILTI